MKIKQRFKQSVVKTLDTAQKGIKWCQDHPVATERAVLVIGTAWAVRKVYKDFYISNKIANEAIDANLASARKSLNALKELQSAGLNKREVLQSLTPEPIADNLVNKVWQLEVSDFDVYDMDTAGMGMLFNLRNVPGYMKENFPVAVVSYEKMKNLLEQTGGNPNPLGDKLLEGGEITKEFLKDHAGFYNEPLLLPLAK